MKYKDTVATDTADLTVTAPDSPLIIVWEGSAPTYVANQGKLTVTGLTSGETVTGFEATTGNDKVRLTKSGNSCYVGHLAAGSYTIRATTSNGRTISQTGTVTAQTIVANAMSPSSTVFYANPDGSDARTGDTGLSGYQVAPVYVGTGPMTTTTDQIATGNSMQKDLYDELLEIQYSSSSSVIHAGSDGVWAQTLTGYPSLNGQPFATVTLSPEASSTGITSKTLSIRSVNPFNAWSSDVAELPDEQDYGLISKYVTNSFSSHTVSYPAITAATAQSGIEVFRNGGVANSTFQSAFSVDTGSRTVTYQLTESALSEHLGGLVELKGYVENKHSGGRWYADRARFGIYVHGAIGATLSGVGTNSVTIGTAFAGNEASYKFGFVTSYSFIKTSYSNGHISDLWGGVDVSGIAESGVGLNQSVYTFTLSTSGATFSNKEMVYQSEKPRFEFRNVSSLGVYIDDGINGGYYYLQPSGTPSVTDGGTEHGYYILHLLEHIQDKFDHAGWREGWLDE